MVYDNTIPRTELIDRPRTDDDVDDRQCNYVDHRNIYILK